MRGVTLLEMLIVLALLIAMAIAIGPTIFTALDERAFDNAADVTSRQLLLARSHAQMTGQPVEVVCIVGPRGESRIVARLVSDDQDSPANVLTQSWSWRQLPTGIAISDTPPQVDARLPAGMGMINEPIIGGTVQSAQIGQEQTVQLVIFLPDGSALAMSRCWLVDDDGRVAQLEINPYTGHPAFKRLEPAALPRQMHEPAIADDLM